MKIVSHRGLSGNGFENSLSGIVKAIEIGVDYIEVDVWQTSDNTLIVFHDAFYDMLTTGSGVVGELPAPFSLGIKLKNGEPIPLLSEVIEITKGRVPLIIEVKSEKSIDAVVDMLQEHLDVTEYIVASFYHEPIRQIKLQHPHIQTAIVFESVMVNAANYIDDVNADYVAISIDTYNKALIEAIHKLGKKLVFYGVNELPHLQLCIKESPYAVITNYPEKIKDYLRLGR